MRDNTTLRELGRGSFLGYVAAAFFFGVGLCAWWTLPPAIRFLFYGGVILFVAILGKLMSPRIRSAYGGRTRAASAPDPGPIAELETLPDGHCWRCGKPVAPSAVVCPRCGATRFAPPTPTVTIPEGNNLPLGTFERGAPAEYYQPGQADPLV